MHLENYFIWRIDRDQALLHTLESWPVFQTSFKFANDERKIVNSWLQNWSNRNSLLFRIDLNDVTNLLWPEGCTQFNWSAIELSCERRIFTINFDGRRQTEQSTRKNAHITNKGQNFNLSSRLHLQKCLYSVQNGLQTKFFWPSVFDSSWISQCASYTRRNDFSCTNYLWNNLQRINCSRTHSNNKL